MKKEYIWKCQTGKVVVKVIAVTDDWRYKDKVYRVYVMRKWWCHMTYDKLEHALTAAAFVSLQGNYNVTIKKEQ